MQDLVWLLDVAAMRVMRRVGPHRCERCEGEWLDEAAMRGEVLLRASRRHERLLPVPVDDSLHGVQGM
jgi:hypothetical protein